MVRSGCAALLVLVFVFVFVLVLGLAAAGCGGEPAPRLNVLLVSVDTLRAEAG